MVRGRQRGRQQATLAAAKMCAGRADRACHSLTDLPLAFCSECQARPAPPATDSPQLTRRAVMPALELRDIVSLIRVSRRARPPFRRYSCAAATCAAAAAALRDQRRLPPHLCRGPPSSHVSGCIC